MAHFEREFGVGNGSNDSNDTLHIPKVQSPTNTQHKHVLEFRHGKQYYKNCNQSGDRPFMTIESPYCDKEGIL